MQQDVEQRLISAISDEKIFGDVAIRGVSSEDFIMHTEVFSFIQTYYNKYNAIPAKAVIETSFPGFTYINDVKEHEVKYLCDELVKSTTKRKAIVFINESYELLSIDPYGAIDSLVSRLTNIRKMAAYSRSFADADAPKRYTQAVNNRAKVAKGITAGIKTGISFFDDKYLGWQPGNLIGIVGRLTSGKSTIAQYLACQAYFSGKRILFLSPEMSVDELNLKWDTFMGKMHGHTFLNKELQLGNVNLKEYKEWLEEVKTRKDWLTLDSANGRKFNLSNIEGFINEFSPDLVVVDGIALLDGVGEQSWTKMQNLSYGLKGLAQNHKIVIIVTAQANRTVEQDEMPRPDQVALGDSFMQACLVPGTIIRRASKPQGYFPIEGIKEGDLVFTHEGRPRKVIKTMNRKVKEEIYKLYLDNYEVIKITGNHELYTKDGWVEAKDLNTNHILYKLSDVSKMGSTRLLKIEKEFYDGDVYNLEVEGDHSYCGNGIIYHNCDIGIFIQYNINKPGVRFITIPKRRNGPSMNTALEVKFDVNQGIIEM